MNKLIDINAYPVQAALYILLQDKTTKKNIIWATDAYSDHGAGYSDADHIDRMTICGLDSIQLQSRTEKAIDEQQARTRKKAEVFTPVWLCNKMNNYADEQWFGRKNVFNVENDSDHTWTMNPDKILFDEGKPWTVYVDSRRLEITCGEAPYLVSRYDVTTGELILPPMRRIGLLDRKLRIVNENTKNADEWIKWTLRAFQSCYGYEYQGDNLLIARINLIMTFYDYYRERMEKEPDKNILKQFANVISWNLWQMDGLKDTIPLGKPHEEYHQMSLFDIIEEMPEEPEDIALPCRIYNWRSNESVLYKKQKRGVRNMGKKMFDFCIGNPPYQSTIDTYTRQEPIYPYFYDAAEQISSKYMLISPARFLFNAGLTSKDWNKKMLEDKHIKVEKYYANSSEVFPNTNINGGVAIVYRDSELNGKPIGHFIPNETLNSIAMHFDCNKVNNITSIIYGGRSDLKFNDVFLEDYPFTKEYILKSIQKKHNEVKELGPNEEYEIKSSSFERTPYVFLDDEPADEKNYYKILGVEKGKRTYKWVKRKYLVPRYPDNNNIEKYKVMLSNADGAAGQIGKPIPARILGKTIIAGPGVSSVPTFMSLGNFDTKEEAINLEKYISTKFVRVLVGIMKITQHITPATWYYVPLQDFTSSSDIDWSNSVAEIDQQLYAKYGLDEKEMGFIETHIKEMV